MSLPGPRPRLAAQGWPIALILSLMAAAPPEAVQIVERLGHRVPPNITLHATDGSTTTFGSLLGKRPLILTLVYYRCPALCALTLGGVAKAAIALDWRLGQEYDAVTVSIDAKSETAVAARKSQAAHLPPQSHQEQRRQWDERQRAQQNHPLRCAIGAYREIALHVILIGAKILKIRSDREQHHAEHSLSTPTQPVFA